MCIIAIKPRGAKLPSDETLRRMFAHNPHGAGFMFPCNGLVEIRKGFMTYDGFRQALRNVCDRLGEDTPLVMHFRITTHGGTCPENTHPFPLTNEIADMRRLSSHAKIGVAHNGIINSVKPRANNVSDTMEFTASVLFPVFRKNHKFFKTQRIMNSIRDSINGSRMCFMDGAGEIYRVGAWIQDGGCWYSNDSFRANDMRWTWTPSKALTGTKHTYTSVRLPWEDHSRIFMKIMPLCASGSYRDVNGFLWGDCMLGVDQFGRLYELDPEDGVAYEAETYLADDVKYDKSRAIYFEVA